MEKNRRKRKGTAHGPRPTQNQHEVAKRLLAGEVAKVGGTGWAFVEPFLAFLDEVGFFEILRVDGAQFIRQMAEVSLLILTYQVKVLLGLAGMNCVGQTLFRDLALLKLIGYTTEQLRDGFCRRGKPGKQKPLHKNVLADAVEKLAADELSYILNESVNAYRTEAGQELAQRGIRRQRREWQNGHQVMVFAGEFYAIFDIEDVFILMGRPPEICWRVNPAQVYRKYAADGLRRPA